MFKHRDNVAHTPLTTDPQGDGVTMKAVSFAPQLEANKRYALVGGAKVTRSRDIRGIERFKQVIYGEKGFPRLHAMVARNPIIMYPPEGTDDARERMKKRRHKEEEEQQQQRQRYRHNEPDSFGKVGEEKSLWDMFEERREVEAGAVEAVKENTTDINILFGKDVDENVGLEPSHVTVTGALKDKELANYHHRQLDALLGLYYEFNHLTLMKLPMSDTLQLLQRCGKEAVAHTLDFEMRLRMTRETRLKELEAVATEEKELQRRQLEVQEAVLEMQMQAAEELQHAMNKDCDPDDDDDDDVVVDNASSL